jgi:ribosomal protein L23
MRSDVVVRRPVITEKTTRLAKAGWFTFRVDKQASKDQIREVVGKTFGVTVREVRTSRRLGQKKAMIKLAPGQKIDLFVMEKEDEKKKKSEK